MSNRTIRQVDLASKFANVCAAFSVSFGENKCISRQQILQALTATTQFIPVLTYTVKSGGSLYDTSDVPVEECLTYIVDPVPLPVGKAVALQLVEESRRLADLTQSLFALRAVQHSDYLMFYLVINHTIVDGPSIFKVVDVFLQHLASQVDETFAVTAPPALDRDIIGEVLANSLSSTEPPENSLLKNTPAHMMTFPVLTDANCDALNNGCVRSVYRELTTEATACILKACRKNQVSFQSLLSAVSALALIKLLHRTRELKWDVPIVQMTPANLRRFLAPGSTDRSVDSIIAMGAAFLRWQMQPLQSCESLSTRLFWSEFVHSGAHRPIQDTLNSNYLLQSVHGGETGSVPYERQNYSVTSTSLGDLSAVVQKHYGALTVHDIHMHAGIWSNTQAQFDHPVVPTGLVNTNTPGFALMHAYTAFGRLKLTGEYYAYSEEFIMPYYDELERILVAVGSFEQSAEVKVGDVFEL